MITVAAAWVLLVSAAPGEADPERWTTATGQGYSEVNFWRGRATVATFSCALPQGGEGPPRLFLSLPTPKPVPFGRRVSATVRVGALSAGITLVATTEWRSGRQHFVASVDGDDPAAYRSVTRLVRSGGPTLTVEAGEYGEVIPLAGVPAKLSWQRVACGSGDAPPR